MTAILPAPTYGLARAAWIDPICLHLRRRGSPMSAGRKGRGSLKNVKNAEGLPITHDDVMIPLGRAKAAFWLLDAMEGQNVHPPEEHAAWLRDICLCTVRDSIQETEREYVKRAGTVPDKAVAS